MGEWITLPILSSGIVPVTYFQDMLEDITSLANPMYAEQNLPGPSTATWLYTSTTVWADIDSTYYHLEFESYGNPLLVQAMVRYSHSVATGNGVFAFALDGVRVGNTLGVGAKSYHSGLVEVVCIEDILTAAAGTHELTLQVKNATVGTISIWKDACMPIQAWEL